MRSLKELMDLTGRVAVITGGGGHLGSVMGAALAENGADIVLVDCDKAACLAKAQKIKAEYGVNVLPILLNLADEKATRKIPSQVLKKFKRIDILINGASCTGRTTLKGWQASFEDQSVISWRKAFDVGLTAAFVLTQACSQALAQSGHGSVINISSIYGVVGPDMSLYDGTAIKGHPAAYDAMKGGLIQLTRYLATTLAPAVRANAISMGGVFRNHKDPFLKQYNARTPLKRMASEEDIKGAALYLASDMSSYVTGQNLIVDGGWTTW